MNYGQPLVRRFHLPREVSCKFKLTHILDIGRNSSVGTATGYGLDGGGEIFRTCPDRPWGPPNNLYNGYRVFSGGKERPGGESDSSPLLVPCSRKSRAIPLLPLCAKRPTQSLSTCTRVHFTFFLPYSGKQNNCTIFYVTN
jgi:hypothetical protein